MPDEPLLREHARKVLRHGLVPARRPDRVWGGYGHDGAPCMICAQRIGSVDHEFILEFMPAGGGVDRFYVHPRCYAAWEFERTKMNGRNLSP